MTYYNSNGHFVLNLQQVNNTCLYLSIHVNDEITSDPLPRSYVRFWENLNTLGRYQSRTPRHWCCTCSWMSMTWHTWPCRSCTSCRSTLKTNPYWIDSLIIWDDDQIYLRIQNLMYSTKQALIVPVSEQQI